MDTDFYHFSPEPRVVQFNKQRYSLRLEPVYWQWLEMQAKRQDKRLGELIADLHHHHDGKNFSGYVRCFCMIGAVAGDGGNGGDDVIGDGVAGQDVGLSSIKLALIHAPAPGLLINRNGRVLTINDPMSKWLGKGHKPIINAELGDYFQLRIGGQQLQDFLAMEDPQAEHRLDFRFSYRARGRISTAKATIVRAIPGGNKFLIWVSISPAISV